MVRKKTGDIRWCSDMRHINRITENNSYTLPRLDHILDRLNEKKVYCSLDMLSCFTQFQVDEQSRNITAFTHPITGKRYRYVRAFFGLKLMPAFVSNIMLDRVFANMATESFAIFIDDVAFGLDSHDESLAILKDTFCRLRAHGIKLKSSKCAFGYDYADIFVYRVNAALMDQEMNCFNDTDSNVPIVNPVIKNRVWTHNQNS